MGIQVLGPLTLDGVDGLAPRDRVVLGVLVVRSPHAVDKEVLAGALYGDTCPPSWPKVVQGSVARLRRYLGAESIRTTPYGYRLAVLDEEIDARNFERLLQRGREHLANAEPDPASWVLSEALGMWRGRAYPDLDEWAPGRLEATRLEGLRLDAQELRVEAEIEAGRARGCLEEARTLADEARFRERRWCLYARALYQAERQTEALTVLRAAGRMLRGEHGLEPGTEMVELEHAILRQDRALRVVAPTAVSAVCPYRGLLSFDAEHADSFFGRDRDVTECLKRLLANGVLVVVGPSGAGKSSVLRAGVVPALRRDGFTVIVTTPGARPLDSLAELPARGAPPVLVVDQAEEVITLCTSAEERAAYFERLRAHRGPLALAFRADRLGALAGYPALARLLERGVYLLAAMGEEELRAAIEAPASQAGLHLEPGLVDLLVQEVGGEPGALPMLSHVLRQTWARREGSLLTVAGYHATGGIRHAVAQTAERLWAELDAQQQAQLRSLFLRLVVRTEDGGHTRVRVPRESLAFDPAHEALLEALVTSRLVSVDSERVRIAHEALAREWPRLGDWLEEDIEGQRTMRHLADAAEAWEAMGRPRTELYRGPRLVAAQEWSARNVGELTAREVAFLRASRAQVEEERDAEREQLHVQRLNNRRLRVSLLSLAVVLVAAVVAGLLAIRAEGRSRREADLADRSARSADARRLAALALLTTEPDVSLLLGVESVRRDSSAAAAATLYTALDKTARLVGVVRLPAEVDSVDVTPDGSTVAVASPAAGGLATFNAETLRAVAVDGDDGAVGVQSSPDGRHLVASLARLDSSGNLVAPTGPLRLLDAVSLATGTAFGGLRPGERVGQEVDFAADGRRVAAVAYDDARPTAALVWDVARPGRPLLRVPMPGIYAAVQLSPHGNRLYLAQRDTVIRVVAVPSGRLLTSRIPDFPGERGPAMVLSRDGSLLATADVDGVVLLDARTLRRRLVLAGVTEGASALAFSRDGTLLAAGYVDGTAVVWDLSTHKPVDSLAGHSQLVSALAFSPDAQTLFTVSPDRQLLAWDVGGSRGFPPWQRYAANPEGHGLYAAIPSPDGRRVAYLGYGPPGGANELQFRELRSGRLTPVMRLQQRSPPQPTASWSPDSRLLVTSGGERAAPRHGISRTHVLQVWDSADGSLVRQRLDADVVWAVFTPDGRGLLVETGRHALELVDLATLRTTRTLATLGHDFWPYATSTGGRTALLVHEGTRDGVLVDVATGSVRSVSFDAAPFAAAFSPDGERLVIYDGSGRWGVAATRSLSSRRVRWLVKRTPFRGNLPWNISWSEDDDEIITAGSGDVDLWGATTLTHLGSLRAGTKDDIVTARPLSDGHTVLMAHPQGDVLRWDLRRQHLIELACRLAGRNLTREEWVTFMGERPYRRTCA